MSVLYSSVNGWFISHPHLVNTFYSKTETPNGVKNFRIKDGLFEIAFPFKQAKVSNNKRKRKHENVEHSNLPKDIRLLITCKTDGKCTRKCFSVLCFCTQRQTLKITLENVKTKYTNFRSEIQYLLSDTQSDSKETFNKCALELSSQVYAESSVAAIGNALGENKDNAKQLTIHNCNFLFPSNCRFYSKDVVKMSDYLLDKKYDLILLDPPWWNKYIRRKKAKTDFGYRMMFNDDIKMLPIDELLNDDGLVVVWCTNSQQHFNALTSEFFSKWNVNIVAKLYWVKVTKLGDPICNFSEPPGKQPFEQIIIATRNASQSLSSLNGRLVVSVPSALHSHKPPLAELLAPYLPKHPESLEVFARYLQPNWTSWGLEVLRFQHESLYEINT